MAIKKKHFSLPVLVLLLCSLFLLAGCQGLFNNNIANPSRTYYIGTEGVRMQFSDTGSPPPRLYYYLPKNANDAPNKFTIGVKLNNMGASMTKGAIFVSGYDPALIKLQGVDIQRTSGGDCTFDFQNVPGSLFAGLFQCDGNSFSWDQNGWQAGTKDIGKLMNMLGATGDLATWLSGIGITVGSDSEGRVSFNLNSDSFDFDVFNLGKGLMIALSGVDLSRWYGKEFLLKGNTPDFPGGEEGYVEFSGEVYQWPANLDHTTQPFLVTSCYGYATYASPEVCIDPNPFSQDRKVCIPQDITFPNSQGAPVAVTKVEQEPTQRSVMFTIYFKNVNAGKVIDLGYLQRCSPYYLGRLDTRHMNVVRVWDVRIGKQRLSCIPNDQLIRLDPTSQEGHITCTYNIDYTTVRSAYKTPLIIEGWYGYMDTMERDMYIKRAG